MLAYSCEKDEVLSLAVLTTSPVSAITQNSASVGVEITSDGGSPVTGRGVCWSTSVNPTTADNKTTNGIGTGTFTSSITGLTPGTTYHLRAYTINGVGTVYGSDLLFTTTLVASPVLTTTSVGAITPISAVCGGVITSDNGSAVTERGVCWGTSSNPTTANSKKTSGTGSGGFACSATGLTPGTTYYVRAYAINSAGTGYGASVSFITPTAVFATVTTLGVGSVTHYTAIGGGKIPLTGGALIIAKGVCWSATSITPTIADAKTNDGTGPADFTSNITGIVASTTYYIRAYATNTSGTGYGDTKTFTTPAPVAPILSTAVISAVTQTTSTSGGTITADMGAAVTARGVCWGTVTGPTVALTTKTTDGTGLGSFTSAITGLLGSTTYYVRSYATNSAGTGYGQELTFTTPAPILSVLTTTVASAVTASTASSGGNITNSGGALVTERGVCWSSTNTTPTTSDTKLASGTGTGTFTAALTGLMGSTVYYLRAYSITSVGTSYGSVITFTTTVPVLPVLAATTAASAITQTTATSGGNITNGGGALITTRGICWNTSTNPTTANNKLAIGTGTGTFTGGLTGLLPNTTYYIRSYATSSVGTSYGTVVSFKTLP